jgi:uncharacterized protein
MNLVDISVPLGLGVASSLHCVQMCGPIVLAYSMGGRGSLIQHLSYNAGRITTYSVLGAAAGAAGSALGLAGRFAGFQQTASIVAGCLMVLAAIFMTGAVPQQGLVQLNRFGISRFFSRTIGQLILSPTVSARLALGLLLGLLPCGLLYAALLKAVSTGTAFGGAVSMLAFGTGTAGALLLIGMFSSTIRFKLGRWSNTVAAVTIAATGIFLVWRGVMMARAPNMSCHGGL